MDRGAQPGSLECFRRRRTPASGVGAPQAAPLAFASALTCTAVILILAAEFAYTRVTATTEAHAIQATGNEVRIPLAEVNDSSLHVYSVDANGTSLRFLVIRKPNGSWGTALDACLICGTAGYRQDGANVVCRNCAFRHLHPDDRRGGRVQPCRRFPRERKTARW